MAHGLSCDRCGKTLLVHEDVRYVAEVRVYAAYDVLEITAEEAARDRSQELARLAEELDALDPEEAQASVAKFVTLDLCPGCQKAFIADPLGGRGQAT